MSQPSATVPANIVNDLNTLASALSTVDTDQAAVAAAVAAATSGDAAVTAANATLATDQAAATTAYNQLLTDIQAWDAGTAPPPPVTAFKAKVKMLATQPKKAGTIDWLALIQELLTLLSGLFPQTTTAKKP